MTATTKSRLLGGGPTVLTTITLRDRQNNEIGNIKTLTTNGRTRVKEVVTDIQGAGLGSKMYREAISDAKSKGSKAFTSDFSVSQASARVWKSLAKDYKVRKVATKTTFNGQMEAADGKGGPVFSIKLK